MNRFIKTFAIMSAATLGLASCADKTTVSGLNPEAFKGTYEGQPLALYTITNANGMEVCFTNFGARIVSVMVPDRDGNLRDVVLGFDSVQDYLDNDINFGATIGRYANRIANGKFTLDDTEYTLYQNNATNCLHGGKVGFDRHVLTATDIRPNSIKFARECPDMEENFPGNLSYSITYTLGDDNSLSLVYEAVTDKATLANFTNHSYFNLNADGSKDDLNCIMYINADSVTPTDAVQIPTGEFAAVEGSVFDFRKPKALTDGLDADDEQMRIGQGWDHNWVLNTGGDIKALAATLASPETGIVMQVYTTEPGLQVYSGNFINGEVGKSDVKYVRRSATCMETQHYPDSPNHPEFPSTVLRPGEKFCSQTIYKFTTDKQ